MSDSAIRGSRGSKENMAGEAACLHKALFRTPISEELAIRYTEAHNYIKPSGTRGQFHSINKIVDLDLDVEAIEFVLRKKKEEHPLLNKIKILSYIAECDPDHYTQYIDETPSFLRALMSLAIQLLRTIFLYAKGRVLIRRYSLV